MGILRSSRRGFAFALLLPSRHPRPEARADQLSPLFTKEFSGAALSGADLSDTILIGADLSDTILGGAKGWTEGQLRQAKSLRGATMPNGQRYEDWFNAKDDKERYGWHLLTKDQKTYADSLKDTKSRGYSVGIAGEVYLAWLEDREGRGENTGGRGPS